MPDMPDGDQSRRTVEEVFALIQSGQLQLSAKRCVSLLRERPNDVNLVSLYGAVLLKLGRADEAESFLRRAIEIEAEFAKPHEDLGRLFMGQDRLAEAESAFREAIRLDDAQPDPWSGLAAALSRLGKNDAAAQAQQQFLQRSPVLSALVKAEQLVDDGELAEAERIAQNVLQKSPDNMDVLRLLARIATDDGRHVVAEGLLIRITKIAPDDHRPHSELGRFLVERSRFGEAIEEFERAVEADPSVADSYRFLGDSLSVVGRTSEALSAYDATLAVNSNDAHALAGRGHMLRIEGNANGAIDAYERCTAANPGFGDAWWSLASMRNYQLADHQVEIMQGQLDAPNLSSDSEIGLSFALARAEESRGNFAAAWTHYLRGNQLKRSAVSYDPAETEIKHDKLIVTFDTDFVRRSSAAEAPKPSPIFILGLPRSGSTLLEQILASHSEVEGAGELPYIIMLSTSLGGQRSDGLRYPEVLKEIDNEQMSALGQGYVYHSSIHRKLSKPFFTDKMPANFAHVGFISMILPHAKIIDARRHPLATTVGNFRQLFAQGKNQSYDLHEFAEYYLEYVRVMDHWDAVLPGHVLKVQYEDVVHDLEGQARRLLDYCGLAWEDRCLDFHRNPRPVNTASAQQVREPLYTDAVDFWKNYEAHLEPVLEILEPVLPDQPASASTCSAGT